MTAFRALVEKAMAIGDPVSPQAREIALRYRDIGRAISGGDAALLEKIRAFRKEAQQDPKLSRLLFLTPEMQAFVDQAAACLA